MARRDIGEGVIGCIPLSREEPGRAIFHHAFAHFLQVQRARPLQNYLWNLTFASADMGPQPSRNVRRLLHGKRSGRTRQGDDDIEADDIG